jgi:hypothetical protein
MHFDGLIRHLYGSLFTNFITHTSEQGQSWSLFRVLDDRGELFRAMASAAGIETDSLPVAVQALFLTIVWAGGIFYATSTYTMELTLTHMTEQARRDYTLAYAPTGNNHSPKFHMLRVTAIPGYRATTRSGYYTKGS